MTTTEAENLARRLHDSHGGQSCAAIEMIREQVAEIERLTTCLKKANDQGEHFEREWYLRGDAIERKDAEIERLKADAELFARHIGFKLERKDALLRESLRVIDKAFDYDGDVFGLMHNDAGDLVDGIEKELGEQP